MSSKVINGSQELLISDKKIFVNKPDSQTLSLPPVLHLISVIVFTAARLFTRYRMEKIELLRLVLGLGRALKVQIIVSAAEWKVGDFYTAL